MNIAQREFFVPMSLDLGHSIEQRDKQGIHHLIRYEWTKSLIRELGPFPRVLECGSGAGYGSYLLAKEYPDCQFLAVDYDPYATEYARAKYQRPNLRFETVDVRQWQHRFHVNPFELILSFDVIEHIDHREIFLHNIVHYLSQNGTLLLSTPCGARRTRANPAWEHHKVEYNALHLFDFLRRFFSTIMRPDDPSLNFPAFNVFHRLSDIEVDYLNVMNPLILRNSILYENPYTQRCAREVSLDTGEEQNQLKGQRQDPLLTDSLAKLGNDLSRAQRTIQQLEKSIAAYEQSRSWRLTAPLRRVSMLLQGRRYRCSLRRTRIPRTPM